MPVAILFLAFFLTEAGISGLITNLNLHDEYFWFEAVTNASAQALISLFTFSILIQFFPSLKPSPRAREWHFLQFGLSAFGIELLLMLMQSIVHLPNISDGQLLIAKAFLYAFIGTTAIYIYTIKPEANRFTCILNTIQLRYATSYLFGVILLLTFLSIVYQKQTEQYEKNLIKNETEQLVLIEKALSYRISEAVLDTLELASQPDFIRHLQGHRNSLEEVQLEFKNSVRIKQSYDQIRFIDSDGQEAVRINKAGNAVEVVPPQELQNKRGRYYVPQTGKLDHGKVYISPLDLNVEHGKVEIPHKPITRISTPVKDNNDNLLGLIVINLNASHLIQHLKDAQKLSKGNIMMLNHQGYWLHDDNPEQLWSFMFEDKPQARIQEQLPELWQIAKTNRSGYVVRDDGYYVFHKVQLNQSSRIYLFEQAPFLWPEWTLITHIPLNEVAQGSMLRLQLFVVFCMLIALVTGIGTYLYTLSQLKRSHAETKVKHMAEHDPLTGLYNRRNLMEQLERALVHSKVTQTQLAVLYLDLDNFKPINDRFGHEAGDEVLKQVSKRLSQILRKTDTLARIGGDEFVILIQNPESQQRLLEIAERIISSFNDPIHIANFNCQLGVSIGIVITRDNNESRDELLKAADLLMLEAKAKGKNCYSFSHIEGLCEQPNKEPETA